MISTSIRQKSQRRGKTGGARVVGSKKKVLHFIKAMNYGGKKNQPGGGGASDGPSETSSVEKAAPYRDSVI